MLLECEYQCNVSALHELHLTIGYMSVFICIFLCIILCISYVYVCAADTLQTKAMLDKYSQLTVISSSWWTAPGPAYGVMKESTTGWNRRYVSYINDGKAELAAEAAVASGEEEDPALTSLGGGKKAARGTGKQAVRKKWEAFRKELDALLDAVHGSDHKPLLGDVLTVLSRAALLEPLAESPGESFMATANSDLTELQKVSR
jgi:hypothetical protein